ncbi:hypothetical protein D9M71_621190 [compost metagenome]
MGEGAKTRHLHQRLVPGLRKLEQLIDINQCLLLGTTGVDEPAWRGGLLILDQGNDLAPGQSFEHSRPLLRLDRRERHAVHGPVGG